MVHFLKWGSSLNYRTSKIILGNSVFSSSKDSYKHCHLDAYEQSEFITYDDCLGAIRA